MAHHFFPRNFYGTTSTNEQQGFTPLFRLLDDFDRYSASAQRGNGRAPVPTFQPKFDVRETENTYELHGELAGIARENVRLEFTDPQTILVRGRVERTYSSGTPPAGLIQGKVQAAVENNDAEEKQAEGERPVSPSHSHRPTVQDEAEAEAEEQRTEITTANKKPADTAKYWISERSIGEFSRSFSFPTRVEQDGVKASLNDGVLTVTVPKAKKHEPRHIAVD